MKHGSLFSGIGGFDLAAEWMGWKNVFHCEINEFGRKVLHYYWPEAISYADIIKTDFTIHQREIDILTGGFPCQPYSLAGKRKGKEDERHLWPEMLRAIREIQPTGIVGENVSGIVSWNGGLVFEEVCTDLENEGYEVQPVILPACAVNAPHRRDRVWFIAHHNQRDRKKNRFQAGREVNMDGNERTRITTNTNGIERCKRRLHKTKPQKTERHLGTFDSRHDRGNWQNFPTQSPICSGDDGLSSKLDGITFPKWRNESIKAYGNAIVPQVAYEIFKVLKTTLPTKAKLCQ